MKMSKKGVQPHPHKKSLPASRNLQSTMPMGPQATLGHRITRSPVMTAQRKKIDQLTTAADPVQKQAGPEDEELLQGRFVTQEQTPEEEEEPLQGAFSVQRLPNSGKSSI